VKIFHFKTGVIALINFSFFIFPFFLYTGIAVQAIFFYLTCILIPSIYFIKNKLKIPRFIFQICTYLIALHLIFPITNLLNLIFPNSTVTTFIYDTNNLFPSILKSEFPSSFFIGSFFIILFYFISQYRTKDKKINFTTKHEPLKYFISGLFPASIIYLLLLFYEYKTGISLKSASQILEFNNPFLLNANTRVFGFYGSPLTVSGVGAAYFAFSWCLFWLCFSNKINYKNITIFKNRMASLIALFSISSCSLLYIIISQGRTAFISSIFILFLIPIILYIRKKPLITIFSIIFIAISGYFIGKNSNFTNRITSVTESIITNKSFEKGNNRIYFWKVYYHMITDKPIIGQGGYWLDNGLREQYYDHLGYNDLEEKFTAHNNFIEVLGCGGILAAIWILFYLTKLFKNLRAIIVRNIQNAPYLSFSLFFMFFANILHALTQNVFFDSSVIYIYISIIYIIMWQAAFKEKALN
jgi:hypothetical protein